MNGGNNGNTLNMNGGGFDGSALNSGDPLLSSNAKFQAISAIAVSQDGVINVADQGKCLRFTVGVGVQMNGHVQECGERRIPMKNGPNTNEKQNEKQQRKY